jgi:hypothetical protein
MDPLPPFLASVTTSHRGVLAASSAGPRCRRPSGDLSWTAPPSPGPLRQGEAEVPTLACWDAPQRPHIATPRRSHRPLLERTRQRPCKQGLPAWPRGSSSSATAGRSPLGENSRPDPDLPVLQKAPCMFYFLNPPSSPLTVL